MTPRVSTLISMLAIAVAAFGLYLVKYRVQAIQNDIAGINRQLDEERENLHVAAAEWAYLTQPVRLQRLNEKYLKLQPVDPSQVADLDALSHGDAGRKNSMVLPASAAARPPGEEE